MISVIVIVMSTVMVMVMEIMLGSKEIVLFLVLAICHTACFFFTKFSTLENGLIPNIEDEVDLGYSRGLVDDNCFSCIEIDVDVDVDVDIDVDVDLDVDICMLILMLILMFDIDMDG